jgi:glucan biosynthesis protein C
MLRKPICNYPAGKYCKMQERPLLPVRLPFEEPAPESEAPLVKEAPKAPRKRMNYLDWLRVWLTILVVWSHVLSVFLRDFPPKQPADQATDIIKRFYNAFNGAYFMPVFYFLAGYFSTPSFNRKGFWEYLKDRIIRLIIPTIVYELTLSPLSVVWRRKYTNPDLEVGPWFQKWFSNYAPVRSHLWFLVLLFVFDIIYALLRLIPAVSRVLNVKQSPSNEPFKTRSIAKYITAIAVLLILITFFVRVAFDFGDRLPVLAQMSYLPVHFISYFLGTPAYLTNGITRLPKKFSLWLQLPAYALFVAYFTVDRTRPRIYQELRTGLNGWQFFFSSFECLFALFYSISLLVMFREFLNFTPNGLGKRIIGGAYTAYIMQYFAIIPFGLLLIGWDVHVLVKMFITMILSVIVAWAIAILIKCIPGIDRVL